MCFHLQLETGHQLRAHIYIVYDGQPTQRVAAGHAAAGDAQLPAAAAQQRDGPLPQPGQQQQQSAAEQPGSSGEQYEW